MNKSYNWWDTEGDETKNEKIIEYVSEVERTQADVYDRYLKFAVLYDPNGHDRDIDFYQGKSSRSSRSALSENVVASNVDTVTASISANDVRDRFMTDGGDWSDQRRAKHLEWYAEGLNKTLDLDEYARKGFKDCAIKGMGWTKVSACQDTERVIVERVLADDIVIDEGECRNGCEPKQLHYRRLVDREELKAKFPNHADAIDRAHGSSGASAGSPLKYWADYRPIERNEVVVIESWKLPYGKKDSGYYKAGRHAIVIDGADLYDEPYEKTFFPFAYIRWSTRDKGFNGIGLVERIAGHQWLLNRLNVQVDRQQEQLAFPTTYVRPPDAKLAVKSLNRLGTVAIYKAELPKTVMPPAVSPETYRRLDTVKGSAFEESGVSRMAASSMKPAGIESGVALREYKSQTSGRFALQEKAHEKYRLRLMFLALDACKDLGEKAPVVRRKTRFGSKKVKWSKVDMKDLHVTHYAASNLNKTPAGRQQTVLEYAQAGIVSQDEARKLLEHPDLEKAMSLLTAARDNIEHCIENMLDGKPQTPEPFQNIKMGTYLVQMSYLKASDDGAPDHILALLNQWLVQAAWVQGKAEEAEMAAMQAAQGPAEQHQFQEAPAALPPAPGLAPESMGIVPA